MAYDEGLAELMREELGERDGLTERRMFGGLAFLVHGNMVCGVHRGGGMFRVGKEREAEALALTGVGPMQFTGRKMGGLVEVTDAGMGDDGIRAALMRLSLDHVATLPPK
jgi:TfoX/Sxy family transcriptional regulator of competence genes